MALSRTTSIKKKKKKKKIVYVSYSCKMTIQLINFVFISWTIAAEENLWNS